jgi:hypothetical protein
MLLAGIERKTALVGCCGGLRQTRCCRSGGSPLAHQQGCKAPAAAAASRKLPERRVPSSRRRSLANVAMCDLDKLLIGSSCSLADFIAPGRRSWPHRRKLPARTSADQSTCVVHQFSRARRGLLFLISRPTGHPRPSGEGRPRQRWLAARPVVVLQRGRRRAGGAGDRRRDGGAGQICRRR